MLDCSVLENLYCNKIRNTYKDTNKTFQYNDNVIFLSNVSRYNISNLCQHGFDLNTLDFTDDELKIYKMVIYDSRFKQSGLEIIKNNYYLNSEDLNFLKENLLSCPNIVHEVLQDKDLCITLGIDQDINHYLDIGFYTSYYTYKIICNWLNDFDQKHFDYFRQLGKVNSEYIHDVLSNSSINLDLRLKLLDENINNPDINFKNIFENICATSDLVNIRIFNILINNDQNNTCLWYWRKLIDKLSINQCNVIYNKYYNNLFSDTRSYNKFFEICCDFGKVLRKKERDLLIKKIKAPSRWDDIDRAKLKINFTEDELLKLNTIQLTAKLSRA